MKQFVENSNNSKKVNDSLSRSLPTKNFFSEHNNKKTYETNDWNKNNSNKSYNKFNRYNNSNSYKSKSNDNYDDNDSYNVYNYKKDKKDIVYNSTKSSPTHLTVDIKSNMIYRAPTPKNIMEGKYKSISPENYHNESTKNNDTGIKSSYSPKKEIKLINNTPNESSKQSSTSSKLNQLSQAVKTPSVEKYVPPNLRNQNKYGNNSSNNINSKPNSFDKPIPSPDLFAASTDKVNNHYNSPYTNTFHPKVQSELTKEIHARQEMSHNRSPLIMPSSTISNNKKIIENKANTITNNNSLLFNSRRHKINPRANNNFNNNYNQLNNNEDFLSNVYNNSNNNKYFINSMNSGENSPNHSDSNSDSLTNYYRTFK